MCYERGTITPEITSLPVRGAWIEITRPPAAMCSRRSLPVRGAWIEILFAIALCLLHSLSLPVRGAWIEISRKQGKSASARASLPVRGAWIEIGDEELLITHGRRRSPCGERGLKCDGFLLHVGIRRRSPCGERGLKYCPQFPCRKNPSSRSPCGERGLKSTQRGKTRPPRTVAPRAGSVD